MAQGNSICQFFSQKGFFIQAYTIIFMKSFIFVHFWGKIALLT